MNRKLLLLVIDGVPWRNWRRLFGNLEGWVASGEARVWRMRSVLPSTSASCYASIHTGLPPQGDEIAHGGAQDGDRATGSERVAHEAVLQSENHATSPRPT